MVVRPLSGVQNMAVSVTQTIRSDEENLHNRRVGMKNLSRRQLNRAHDRGPPINHFRTNPRELETRLWLSSSTMVSFNE